MAAHLQLVEVSTRLCLGAIKNTLIHILVSTNINGYSQESLSLALSLALALTYCCAVLCHALCAYFRFCFHFAIRFF